MDRPRNGDEPSGNPHLANIMNLFVLYIKVFTLVSTSSPLNNAREILAIIYCKEEAINRYIQLDANFVYYPKVEDYVINIQKRLSNGRLQCYIKLDLNRNFYYYYPEKTITRPYSYERFSKQVSSDPHITVGYTIVFKGYEALFHHTFEVNKMFAAHKDKTIWAQVWMSRSKGALSVKPTCELYAFVTSLQKSMNMGTNFQHHKDLHITFN